MYLAKLILENFQSHEKSVLDLDPHLNVLVGVSNIGKSSVSRALSCLLFNQWDKSWVRSGTKFARITVVSDTGIEVVREKGEKVNRYILTLPGGQPQIFDSFGVHVPEAIQQALKIHEVIVGKEDALNLNLSTQLSPLFMLSNTGAQNARIMGTLSGGHYLDWAIREINRDKGQIAKEKTLKEAEVVELQTQVTVLKQVECFSDSVTGLEQKLASIQTLEARLQALQGLFERTKAFKAAWLKETAKEDLLGQFSVLSLDDLTGRVDNLKKLITLLGVTRTWKFNFTQLSKTQELLDKVSVASIPERDRLDKIKRLKELASKVKSANSSIENLNTCLANTNKEYLEVGHQYSDMLSGAGVCPVCNQSTKGITPEVSR